MLLNSSISGALHVSSFSPLPLLPKHVVVALHLLFALSRFHRHQMDNRSCVAATELLTRANELMIVASTPVRKAVSKQTFLRLLIFFGQMTLL